MKSTYSIVYLSLKPTVQEQIAIGLLLTNGEKAHFEYSPLKLKYISKLMNNETYGFVNNYLSGLKSDFKGTKLSSVDYLSYLTKYRNNLVIFSQAVDINMETNEANFKKLFVKFIFEDAPLKSVLPSEKVNINTKVKNILYPKIKDNVNIDKTFTPKEIPSLLIPTVKVNFIGRNDNPVAGEVIDFEGSINSLSNKISHFISLIKAFEIEKEEGKFFVIGDEPRRENPSHETWQHLKEWQSVEIVSTNEIEKVSDYIHTHHVRPFQQN
ncbi:MAG: hypothetical protein ABI723_15550 [Bacteroidia bacterium]